jgi:hypothetical protein
VHAPAAPSLAARPCPGQVSVGCVPAGWRPSRHACACRHCAARQHARPVPGHARRRPVAEDAPVSNSAGSCRPQRWWLALVAPPSDATLVCCSVTSRGPDTDLLGCTAGRHGVDGTALAPAAPVHRQRCCQRRRRCPSAAGARRVGRRHGRREVARGAVSALRLVLTQGDLMSAHGESSTPARRNRSDGSGWPSAPRSASFLVSTAYKWLLGAVQRRGLSGCRSGKTGSPGPAATAASSTTHTEYARRPPLRLGEVPKCRATAGGHPAEVAAQRSRLCRLTPARPPAGAAARGRARRPRWPAIDRTAGSTVSVRGTSVRVSAHVFKPGR